MNSRVFNVDCITSRTNVYVSKLSKLLTKKGRYESKLFALDGIKLFREAVLFNASIKYIVVKENVNFDTDVIELIKQCQKHNIQVLCMSDGAYSKLTDESSPQGIITVCDFLSNHIFSQYVEATSTNDRVIMLDSIRDPGNMGTILRNAAAFGIDTVVISSDCVDIYSPKVLRATMGAIFKVKIIVSLNMLESVKQLKSLGKRVISLTLNNESLTLGRDKIDKTDVFVIGNEGHGISRELIQASSASMIIPMQENTESLNAAIAATIVMWEQYK